MYFYQVRLENSLFELILVILNFIYLLCACKYFADEIALAESYRDPLRLSPPEASTRTPHTQNIQKEKADSETENTGAQN